MPKYAFVVCTDNTYASHAGTCIFSLLLSTVNRDFDIHVVGVGLDDHHKSKYLYLSKIFHVQIYIHEASSLLSIFADKNQRHRDHRAPHLSDTALIRLLYASVIDQSYDRLAYIDCDVVFLGDAVSIFGQDLGDSIIGAVPDLIAARQSNSDKEFGCEYFNSGILLIDDKRWRAEGLQSLLLDILGKADPQILQYADQDILNLHFRKIGYAKLPVTYNYQYMATTRNVLAPDGISPEQAVIVHFAGQIKPWQEWVPPFYSKLYDQFRLLSPWANQYQRQRPEGLHQLGLGFDSLVHQRRFSEACIYSAKLIETLKAENARLRRVKV